MLTSKIFAVKLFKHIFILLATGLLFTGCEDYLEAELPNNELLEEEALESKEDVLQVLNSCYDVNANVFNGKVQYAHELLGDNLSMLNESGDLGQIYNRNVSIYAQ